MVNGQLFSTTSNDLTLQLMQAFFEGSQDACLLLSSNLEVLAMNPTAQQLFQRDQPEVSDQNIQTLCAERGCYFNLSNRQLADLKTGKIVKLSCFWSGAEGGQRKFHWEFRRLPNLIGGSPLILQIGNFTQEVGLSAIDMNNLLASIPGRVYWKDKDGVYLGCTHAVAHSLGLSIQEVIGKTDYDFFEKSQADKIRLHDNEVMRYRKPKIVEESITLDGVQQVYGAQKRPLLNRNNDVIGVVVNSLDITELKELELELRRAREVAEIQHRTTNIYLQHIVECMPGALYWKNKDGVYLGCNTFLVKMLNLNSKEDMIGKTDYDLWPEYTEKLRANDKDVMLSRQPSHLEETIILPTGEQRSYAVVKVPFTDEEGNVIGIIGNSMDITEIKNMTEELRNAKEAAEVASKAKSEFLAVVSHELRIPLTSILGMTYYLSEEATALTAQQREYLENTKKSADHLLTLVNDLLDFSKIEAGKFELAPAPLDLRVLMEEITLMFFPQATEKKLDLLLNYQATAPHKIIGDSRALRQIFINLIGNAIKFTHVGHVLIEIVCLKSGPKEVCLKFSVIDTGIGIAEDKLESIFERFQQVDASFVRKYGGAGLGLTITRRLVEMMGGVITVKSLVGKGSTFTFNITFPLQAKATIEQPWAVYQSTVHILLVDDTPRGAVLKQQLSPTNCDVISGEKALNTFITAQQSITPYHVVIIDVSGASMDAFELANSIRFVKGIVKPMLVALLPKESLEQRLFAKAAGFFESVSKPVQPMAFQTTLTAAWEKWIEYHEQNQLMSEDQPKPKPQPLANITGMLSMEFFLKHTFPWISGNLYWKNREGIYLSCTHTMAVTMGAQSVDFIIGKTDHNLWPNQAAEILANDKEVMRSGRPVNVEESMTLPSGEVRYYNVVKVPIRDETGCIIGILGNLWDRLGLENSVESTLAYCQKQSMIENNRKEDL